MLKLLGGILLLVFGVLLAGWIAYNLLVQRLTNFKGSPIPAMLFASAMLFVGGKWVIEGWGSLPMFAPRRKSKGNSKKKAKRPALEPLDD